MTIQPKIRPRVVIDLFRWFAHDHSTENVWSLFSYPFFPARPFNQKSGSSLTDFLYLYAFIWSKFMILFQFHSIQKLGSSLIYFFYFLYISCNDHSTKIRSHSYSFTVGIYLLKVNYRNTRTKYEICSKLTIKTPERRHLA